MVKVVVMVAGTTIAAGAGVGADEILDESVEGLLVESFIVESTGEGLLVESGILVESGRIVESVVAGSIVESIGVGWFIVEDVSDFAVVVSVPAVGLSVAL